MSTMTPKNTAVAELIQKYEPNITNRSRRVASIELSEWTPEEVKGVMDQLVPRDKKRGSDEPCGPDFNQLSTGWKAKLMIRFLIWSMLGTATMFLLPIQIGAAIYLLLHGRLSAIWRELPKPTALLFDQLTRVDAY
ncbi:MAG: hypothetical protein Q9193_004746, partial [Seirophora villosa]